jgi:hypothetical protein
VSTINAKAMGHFDLGQAALPAKDADSLTET